VLVVSTSSIPSALRAFPPIEIGYHDQGTAFASSPLIAYKGD